MTVRLWAAAAAVLACAVAGVLPAGAQGFGKNKVQYEPLDWSVFEARHLRLHFHTEEESLARHLVVFAESACVEYDGRFRLTPRHPIPFLLYSAHYLFQQTNATPGLISEGTGGLTELVKGRVLLPHTGSWHRLRWVTRHELTHAYMLEKITRVMHDNRRTQNYLPPLWFIEGLAEYCGTTWDPDAEGLLRDAVLSGEALPLTRSDPILGTVLMYKEGQSFLLYLAERFGDAKIFDLLDNWYRAEDFETTFRITFGMSIAQVDDEWFASVRRRYYPVVATAVAPAEVGTRLTLRGPYNLGPRVLPSESSSDSLVRFCYFSATEGATDLMLSEPRKDGKRHASRILRGGQSPSFESFHLFQNRPDTSPSGLIALSSKEGGRDALVLVDSGSRRVVRRFNFPNLVAFHNPGLVPGDTAAVFSAQDYSGRSDIYRARWGSGRMRLDRLTNDDFDDLEPDVSPDGRYVVFASDRGERAGRYSLFRIALAGGRPEEVSRPEAGDDRQPVYSPDGRWIAYRSTRGGTSDLWLRPADPSFEARRVTRLLGPVSDPEWLPDGRALLFTAQHAVQFQTYRMRVNPDSLAIESESPPPRAPVLPRAAFALPASGYQRRIGFDIVQSAVSYDPTLGSANPGAQVALSDVLGNEQIFVYIGNDSERFGNFWAGFQGALTYINRAHRLNWGVGGFRLTEVFDVDLDEVRREPRVGIQGVLIYPYNKFDRLEVSLLARHASNHLLRSGELLDVDLLSNFLSLVHDNTRWTWMGPSGGSRMFLSAGFTRDLTTGTGDFTTSRAEVRHYSMPLPYVVSAARVQGQSSGGKDAQSFYLGGPYALRGFDRRDFSGNHTVLLQEEIRFPLVRGLTLAVPAPWQFPFVGGAVFADAAWLWEDGRQDRGGSVGAGFYLGGGYYPVLRWNYVWPTRDFRTYPDRAKTQFSIAFNF